MPHVRLFRGFLLAAICLRGAGAAAQVSASNEIAEFKARAGTMTAAAVSADDQLVLTGEDDGLVTLWSVATGASVQKYRGHARAVLSAALLSDGKRAVTCGDDNTLIVWDLTSGRRMREIKTGEATPFVMSCSTSGSLAAVGGSDGVVTIWDLFSAKRITSLNRTGSLCGLQFSPDGHVIAAGYADGLVVLWNTGDWSPRRTIPARNGASVGALAFSADSRILVTGDQNGAASAWNVSNGEKVNSFAVQATPTPTPPGSSPFPGSAITPGDQGSIAFVHVFGEDVLTAGQNIVPKLWNIRTGQLVAPFPWLADTHFFVARYGFPFAAAAVSPRGDLLVTMKDNLAQVWRLPSPPAP